MLSRDSVHLSELQRDPNKYVKYKFKKNSLSITRNREWDSLMFFLLMMMNSASASLQVLWMWAACISLHTFQRTLRVSACRGQRTWKKGDEVGEQRHAVEEVIENLGLKHPIIFDVYNLCEYYQGNKLSSFNVSMLKDMCGYFEIPHRSRDLKRDLLAKVSELVKECECSKK